MNITNNSDDDSLDFVYNELRINFYNKKINDFNPKILSRVSDTKWDLTEFLVYL
jgi:uncharacterized protein (DUF2164 family)